MKKFIRKPHIIKCSSCGLMKNHKGKGMCNSCWSRQYAGREVACLSCGEKKRHKGHGLCRKCHSRTYYSITDGNSWNKYGNSEKGKQKIKEYSISNSRKESRGKYCKSEKGRLNHRMWRAAGLNGFGEALRNLVYISIKRSGFKKGSKTEKIIGCSFNKFVAWIESKFQPGMTWENFGRNGWSIDHYIPSSYAKTEEEVLKLNNYKNLRPMWLMENIAKADNLPFDANEKLTELKIK